MENMKMLIIILATQWYYISCRPGLIDLDDLPDFHKVSTISPRGKSAYSTKASSYNSITDIAKSTTPASITSGFHPLKFSQEDVIKGKNAIYGSQTRLPNGGIIFAISQAQRQGQDSQSQQMISASPPQPVLMQYLSEEGIPQQAAIQYIQLLRPVMMVPASPYLPAKPHAEVHIKPEATSVDPVTPGSSVPLAFSSRNKSSILNPYGPYASQPLIGAYSSPHTSFNPRPAMQQRPTFDMTLNMNEYMPSASSPMAILAPRSSITQFGQYAYKSAKLQARAQRA